LQRRDLHGEVAVLDRQTGHAASISASFDTNAPGRSTNACNKAIATRAPPAQFRGTARHRACPGGMDPTHGPILGFSGKFRSFFGKA